MVLASLTSTLTHQVAVNGAIAVLVLMAIDAVFPAGSELVMVFAGAVAAGVVGGSIDLFGLHPAHGLGAFLILASSGTLGYLVGASVGWLIGYQGGTRFLSRYGHWLHLTPSRLEQAERWFERWGSAGFLIGRVVPLVRSFVSIPAGAFRMRFLPYAGLTLIGSAVWAFGLAGIGWALGASYGRFNSGFAWAEYAVVAAVIAAVGVGVVTSLRSRRAGSAHPERLRSGHS